LFVLIVIPVCAIDQCLVHIVTEKRGRDIGRLGDRDPIGQRTFMPHPLHDRLGPAPVAAATLGRDGGDLGTDGRRERRILSTSPQRSRARRLIRASRRIGVRA
jgi:hypothetical protein